MGGFGSGRRRRLLRVDECYRLDASCFMKQRSRRVGLWGWTSAGELRWSIRYELNLGARVVEISYRHSKGTYPVDLLCTQPPLGGTRWWFACPLWRNGTHCGARVQKLYLPPGARQFGCRTCYHLIYYSRRQNAEQRALNKAQDIRVMLGGTRSILEPFPDRPKGMRQRTYERLRERALQAEALSWALLGRRLGLAY